MSTASSAPQDSTGREIERQTAQRALPLPISKGTVERALHPSVAFRARRAILLAAAALALFAGVQFWRQGWKTGTDASPQSPAPPASESVFALARLEPEGEVVSVSAPDGAGAARIRTLNVIEGQSVQKDEVLAVLDNEARLLAQRDLARSRVEQANAQLEQARLIVEVSRNQLGAKRQSAEVTLASARSRLQRRMQLAASKALTREELEDSQREYETAVQNVAEIDASLARYAAPDGSDPIDVRVAREDLAVAQAALQEAEAHLEEAYVRAPFAGTVLQLKQRPGEPINQQPLLDLGATSVMMARIEVYETDVREVSVGHHVRLTSPALNSPLSGTVTWIGSLVRRQSTVQAIPAANTDARIVEVLARLDQPSTDVAARFVGLQVRAEVLP